MMTAWRNTKTGRLQPIRRGAGRRGFFVSASKCQARVLACQAPALEILRRVLAWLGGK